MRRTLVMLLAGGAGSRLNVLARLRAKPAVPFGGIYRVIDFTLSNVMNSGVNNVAILTQYKPYSLMKHIGTGAPWDFIGHTRGAKILPPKQGEKDSDWYQGTADAIAQNVDYIHRHRPERVLILSGDHIYYMNYSLMIEFHKQKKAELTIAMMEVPWKRTHHFGTGVIDEENRLIAWEEKPRTPKTNLASMGIYVFNTDFLLHCLEKRVGHDFGRDIIPQIISSHRVYAYQFQGYWQDVGTIEAYWQANMNLLDQNSGLAVEDWGVRTNFDEEERKGDRPPTFISNKARVCNAIISPHCIIEGEVFQSILSPGVRVAPKAKVRDSIIMHDTVIQEKSVVDKAILDKNVIVARASRVGNGANEHPNKRYPDHLYNGLTVIGKNAHLPAHIRIGRNCIIFPDVREQDFTGTEVPCGSTIQP